MAVFRSPSAHAGQHFVGSHGGIAFPDGVITTSSRERDFRLSDPDRHDLHQTLSRFCSNHGEFGPIPFAGPRVPQ
jgi:hypothetical protein